MLDVILWHVWCMLAVAFKQGCFINRLGVL